jgi:hypothetical protein
MAIDQLLASNEALGVALTAVLLALGYANRVFFRDVRRDPDRLWRIIAWSGLAALAALIGWISSFGNWRQLIGAPYRTLQQFPSERMEYSPPSATVRMTTEILLVITLLLVACLVARHVGGYGTQILLLLASLFLWLPLFVVRERFNINLGLGFGGDPRSPLDILSYILWVLMAWLVDVALILASFGALLAAVTLPVTLLLDLTRLRQPRITAEAASFFDVLSQRANSAEHRT